MLISACTVILAIICEALTTFEKDYTPNVGTVLFSVDDTQKKQWAKADIGLLRARRYFQSLLPPPIFINTFNEDYVNILLGYFRDAYSAIKREAPDPETDTIMTSALSDAIGGYLKVWVLPVAKLDYYGGTVSQDNVVKLFQFYNEIKRYLDTDGNGWRKPDENVLNSITINVAPLKLVSNTRSMKNPCDHLAYFEKTNTGLSIPMPNVNWNDKASTMFIPLKNVSLIMMNTPDSSHNLMKYFDAARGCIQVSNPKEQDKFDEKFQSWLANEVVPHLKDDNLYLALGSVLTLVNRTRDLCNSVLDLYGNRLNIITKQPRIPVDLTSKKMWIISIILLIEIAWCIPALIYILCTKKGHKKECCSNVYLYIDNNKPDKKGKGGCCKIKTSRIQHSTCSTALKTIPYTDNHGPCAKNGLKLFRKSNMEFEAQYPSSMITNTAGTDTRSYFSSKDQSASAMRLPCCAPKNSDNTIPKKSSLKKTSSHIFPSNPTNSTQLLGMSSQEPIVSAAEQSVPNSYTTVQRCSRNASPMSADTSCCQKSRRASSKREKDEEYRAAEDRRQIEECKKYEERRKADECRKREERRRSEESRKLDEYKKGEQCRKLLEERRKAEECRKLDDRRRSEECRKHEERRKSDECRRLEERRKDEECRKYERKRAEENRKNNEYRKDNECRNERRQSDESRRYEDRKQAEECRKFEECKNDECVKFEEDVSREEFCVEPKTSQTMECIVQKTKYEVVEIKKNGKDQPNNDESEAYDDENGMEESQDTETDSPCGATCACTGCMVKGCRNSMSNSTAYGNTSSSSRGVSDKQVETKTTRFQVTKELKSAKPKGGIKLTSGKPYLEITIDRPTTEICVDLAQFREHTPKPSKIPKPACNVFVPVTFPSGAESKCPQNEKHKSMIPQPKKKTEDDISIKSRCHTSSDNKLNETF